jgi:hypothetical protein
MVSRNAGQVTCVHADGAIAAGEMPPPPLHPITTQTTQQAAWRVPSYLVKQKAHSFIPSNEKENHCITHSENVAA